MLSEFSGSEKSPPINNPKATRQFERNTTNLSWNGLVKSITIYTGSAATVPILSISLLAKIYLKKQLSARIDQNPSSINYHSSILHPVSQRILELDKGIKATKQQMKAALFSVVPFLGIPITEKLFQQQTLEQLKDKENLRKKFSVQLLRGIFYPSRLVGLNWEESDYLFPAIKNIPVDRQDGQSHNIRAYCCSSRERFNSDLDSTKPTVVLFHGNDTAADAMGYTGGLYIDMGFNIVMPTIGGYPASDENISTSEITTYQDANAVIQYLKDQGHTQIIVHGLSMGGSLALAAADLHPDIVKCVIADQTFTSAYDVAANAFKNRLGNIIPSSIITRLVQYAFPKGIEVPGVIKNGTLYTTDGLDNKLKASKLKCHIICVKSDKDGTMGKGPKKSGYYSDNFADEITHARYDDNEINQHLFEIEGQHAEACALDDRRIKTRIQEILEINN